jgi:hypothetical protein
MLVVKCGVYRLFKKRESFVPCSRLWRDKYVLHQDHACLCLLASQKMDCFDITTPTAGGMVGYL